MTTIKKLDNEEKPFAVVGETGTVIRSFYKRQDAVEWLEWEKRTGNLT